MIEALEDKFSKYEVARILGARALQVAMDAPLLLKIPEKDLEEINFNPLEIAKKELMAEVLPITVNRPMPKRKEQTLKILTKKEVEEKLKKEAEANAEKEIEEKTNTEAPKDSAEIKSDESLEGQETKEEKSVEEDAEIMELANPEDEQEGQDENKPAEV